MSAAIVTSTEKQISVPLAEFLTWAGIPDPENWAASNGSQKVYISITRTENP